MLKYFLCLLICRDNYKFHFPKKYKLCFETITLDINIQIDIDI